MTNLPEGIEFIHVNEGRQVVIRFNALRVNGIAHRGSLTLRDYGFGLVPQRDNNGHDHWALSMWRNDRRIQDDPTPAARKAAPKLLVEIARAWIAANPQAFGDADEAARLSEIAGLDAEIAAMEADLKRKRAARARLFLAGQRKGTAE